MFSLDELREANEKLIEVLADIEGVIDTGIAGGVLIVRTRSDDIEHLIPISVFDIPVSISVVGDFKPV